LYVRVRGCAWDQGDEVESEVEGKEEKVGIGEEDLGEEFVVPRPSVLLRRYLLSRRARISAGNVYTTTVLPFYFTNTPTTGREGGREEEGRGGGEGGWGGETDRETL